MTNLKEGDKAPVFSYTDDKGTDIQLADLKGSKVILFFYPKDNTPGCTAEACNIRDNYDTLLEKGFKIIGISPDSEASHVKFKTKHSLPFPLVADTEKEVLNNYGVWGEKKMYGRTYMGVHRTTFIIDGKGNIDKIFNKVKTKEHTDQILKAVDNK